MAEVRWERYPEVAGNESTRAWLRIEGNLGLAQNTIEAYGRALEDYLKFNAPSKVDILTAKREHIAAYIHDLASRRNPQRPKVVVIDSGAGLANATLQQRLTAIRLFYDFLIEEGIRTSNPVGRGRYTPGKGFGNVRDRGLIPHFRKLPWIPSEEEWRAVMQSASPSKFGSQPGSFHMDCLSVQDSHPSSLPVVTRRLHNPEKLEIVKYTSIGVGSIKECVFH